MKAQILTVLRNTEGYVSGQELCRNLGVSRTAVWKVIGKLRQEGYVIDAVPNKGYCLKQIPDILTKEQLTSLINTEWIAREIQSFEELDSTNTYAKQIADSVPDGTLVVAEVQNQGKGSKGRGWESKGGYGIWMSLILKPNILPPDASKLTLVAALSTARACRQYTQLPVQIKWPNDIVCDGKKLCGILTEMSAELNYVNHIVLGIGINVNSMDFSQELQERATSLYLETGREWNRGLLIREIMNCFEEDYRTFLKNSSLEELLDEYIAYSVTLGSPIQVLDRNGSYDGTAININKDGHLVVRKSDGSLQTVFADEVSVRGVYGYV